MEAIMCRNVFFVILLMILPGFSAYAADFTADKDGKKIIVGTFDNQSSFVKLLKAHLADESQLKEEQTKVHGLMFFIMTEPKRPIKDTPFKKILEFYNYPERYGVHAGESDKLYSTKQEALHSAEMKGKCKKFGSIKVFIIGIDVKEDRMHSISKSNGIRLHLNSWY